MLKRQKERQRQERQQEKTVTKAARREDKKARDAQAELSGEDPDLIGIVAGPQPRIED